LQSSHSQGGRDHGDASAFAADRSPAGDGWTIEPTDLREEDGMQRRLAVACVSLYVVGCQAGAPDELGSSGDSFIIDEMHELDDLDQDEDEIATRVAAAAKARILIESLDGPVTAKEIAAYKAYMKERPPADDNVHNTYVYGSTGDAIESLGNMYEVTHDREILDRMIQYADHILGHRNDPKTGRMIWTGRRERCWPNSPASAPEASYCGTENGDIVGHLAYCAKLIAQNKSLWNDEVPVGDPQHFGATYIERARTYLSEGGRTMDDLLLKWYVDPKTRALRTPDSPLYGRISPKHEAARGKGVPWNQQAMIANGFQRLAETLEVLGEDPKRVDTYDAIVKTFAKRFLEQVVAYDVKGQKCYKWSYADGDRKLHYMEDEGHASFDVKGMWRAFQRKQYGLSKAEIMPFANTARFVMWKGGKQFANRVDGSEVTLSSLKKGWLYLIDFRDDLYEPLASPVIHTSKPGLAATILRAKNRRARASSVVEDGLSDEATAADERPQQ
jgi:hypothetical protein